MLRNWLQCYCGDTLSGVWDLAKLDFQSLTLAFCYYSSDSSFFFLNEEFTLLRKAPDSSGSDSSAVILLCVIFCKFTSRFLYISDLARYFNQSIHFNVMFGCFFCRDFLISRTTDVEFMYSVITKQFLDQRKC